MANGADGEITLGLKIKESLALMQAQLNQIAKQLKLNVPAKLDKSKTKANINSDFKSIKVQDFKVGAKIDKTATRRQLKADLKSMDNQAKVEIGTKIDLEKVRKQLANANLKLDTNIDTSSFDRMGGSLENVNSKIAAITASTTLYHQALTGLERAARNLISTAVEIDGEITNLRMVTGDTYEEAFRQISEYTQFAKQLGSTTIAVSKSANEWLRQGKSISETNELIAQSMKLSIVGMMDSEIATQRLTSTMKGYHLAVDDVAGVVDKLTAVDMAAAVSADGIAESLSHTASSAYLAGLELDKIIAYITVVGETTQKTASVVGESFKSIFARMGKVTNGDAVDDFGEDISQVETTLRSFGIELRESETEFRNFGDVLDEVGQKWNTFSTVNQRKIATAFGGVYQSENFLALMNNYEKVADYIEVAANSAGTATEKFNAYQESVESHINTLKASAEALATQTVPTELINGLLDAGSAILDFATNTNLLSIALSGLAAALAVRGLSAFGSKIKNVYENVSRLSTAFNLLDKAAKVDLSDAEFSKLLTVTKGLNSAQLKLIVTNKALTNEQRMAILMANGMTEAEAAETLATMGLTTAEGAATTATFSLSGAFKALTAAIASNPIGFIVVALTTAISVISTVNSKIEEANRKIIEAGTEAAEHGEKIITLANAYLELSDAVEAGTASREDLMAAQADLMTALGLEGQSVDELVAKYGSLKTAILEASMAALETDISVAVAGSKTAQKQAISDLETYLGTSINAGTDGANILQYLKDQGFSGISIGTKSGTMILPHSDIWDAFNDPTIEELLENRKYLQDAMNAVRQEFGSDSVLFQSLSENYQRYDEALKPAVEAIDKSNDLIAQYYIQAAKALNDPKTKEEFETFKKSIVENLKNDLDWNEYGTFSAEGLIDNILSTDRLYSQYYAEVEQALEQAETAVKEHADGIRGTLETLWDSESFADTKKSILEMAQSLDGINASNIDSLISSSSELAAVLEEDGMSAQFLAHILQTEAMGGNGFALITDEALTLNKALEGLRGQFDEITAAKSRYDAAMSVQEKDVDFKSYTAAFKELNDQFVAGTVNSNKFWAAAEFLFGTEQLNAWGWADGLDQIYAAMQRNVGIFEDADSAGAGFLDRLYELSEAGQIKADDGSVLMQIEKLSDGSYDFQFDNKNLDALADKLGITREAALSCLEALSMYDSSLYFYDLPEVMKAIDEIGLSAEFYNTSDAISGTVINAEALTDQLISLGYTNKDIHDILTTMQNVEGVTFLSTTQSIDSLTQSLKDLALASDDGVEVKVNTDGLAELMAQLSFSKEDTEGLITKLGEADGITLTNAEGEVIDLDTALKNVNDIEFSDVASEIQQIQSATDLATQSVETLQRTINNLRGKTITVTVDIQRRGDVLSGIPGFAKGTQDAPETDALVGEDGEELIQSGDKAYLVGKNGAEIVHLKEGDKVYTAEQTRKIKRGAKIVHGIVPAYAGGRINTGKRDGNGYVSVLDSTKTTTTTTPTTTTPRTTTTAKDAESEFERLYKYHQHLLAMDQESVEDYLVWLNAAYKDAYQKGETELDDYYKYEEEVFSKIKASLDDVRKEHENAITLTENWLDQAIERRDYDKISQYTGDIIAHYRKMQEELHKQAEFYRDLGYSDTSDEVSKLSDKWWEYYDKIKEVSAKAWQQVVDNANDAVDSIQNVFDTLKDAAQEYAENGHITVDTLQAITKLGIENLAYLEDENGLLVINQENIQKVIAARTEQMAIETALQYVQQIRTALTDNDTAALNRLIFATDAAAASTWDFVYAQLQLLGLNGDQYNAALQRINTLRALSNIAVQSIGQVDGVLKQSLEDSADALADILKYVEEMIKQEIQNQIDALEQQIDDYQTIVDLQKKSLDLERKKDSYTKSVAEKTKQIAQLQQQLSLLELDTSRESLAKQADLREQLADLQSNLSEEQADHAYDVTSDMLDNMADAYEQEKRQEIKVLEDSISSEEKIYQMAISRISEKWDTLYDDLIAWNTQYGTVINDDLTAAWEAASRAVQEYGSYLEAVQRIQAEINSLDSGTSLVVGNTSGVTKQQLQTIEANKQAARDIVNEARMYSASWSPENTQESKDWLHQQVVDRFKELEKLGIYATFNPSSGVWTITRDDLDPSNVGKTIYAAYHTGGVVGDQATLKQDEVLAKLQKGEVVLTEGQQDQLYRYIDAAETMLAKYGGLFGVVSDIGLFASKMQEQTAKDARQAQNIVQSSDNRALNISVTAPISTVQKLDESEIRKMSQDISKYTINELDEMFSLYGKRNFRP